MYYSVHLFDFFIYLIYIFICLFCLRNMFKMYFWYLTSIYGKLKYTLMSFLLKLVYL